MIPKFVRKKFRGVQVPLGKWILRHIFEFIVLSPAIFVTFIWLKLRKYEVLQIGESPVISRFIAPLEPELRLRSHNLALVNKVIVINLAEDANSQIRKMYDKYFTILGSEKPFHRRLVWWASRFANGHSLLSENKSDITWSTNTDLHFLSNQEIEEGFRFLADRSVVAGKEFICYAVRSESYYLRLAESGVSVKPRSVRNPNEDLYLQALNSIGSNLPIFRMGKDIEIALEVNKYPDVVDYATRYRTDFLDVFLISRCKFLLVGNTGLFWISALFGKPTLHCDLYDIRHQVLTRDLMIFQKVLLKNEKRIATISEMLKMRSEYSDERHQGRLGVELIKNTSDEILAACNEMSSRIDGTWITTPQDEELQQRYLDLIIKYSDQPTWRGGGRVGTQFLRDNQDLLK
jgi:putative glycosyltransferase (TIGR04372 family)